MESNPNIIQTNEESSIENIIASSEASSNASPLEPASHSITEENPENSEEASLDAPTTQSKSTTRFSKEE